MTTKIKEMTASAIWCSLPGVARRLTARNAMFVVLAVGLLTPTARANLLTNGSFETPLVPVGGFSNFNSGSTGITGWTAVGPQVSIVSTAYVSFGLSFPAEDGSQWLDLTGDASNAVEGVEQTVATTAGATYDLSYFVGNQVNPGGPYGTTSTVNVYVGGALVQSAVNSSGAGGTKQVWEQFNTSFVASGSSATIEFLNGDPKTDNTNGLDNVALTLGTTSPTPEPSTLAMFTLALFAAGILALQKPGTA